MTLYHIGYCDGDDDRKNLVFEIYPLPRNGEEAESFEAWLKDNRNARNPVIHLFENATVRCPHGNLCTKGKIYGWYIKGNTNDHIFYYVVE